MFQNKNDTKKTKVTDAMFIATIRLFILSSHFLVYITAKTPHIVPRQKKLYKILNFCQFRVDSPAAGAIIPLEQRQIG